MDQESIIESRLDAQNKKHDHISTQMRDLSQSIHSMGETLKELLDSMEKTMIPSMKQKGRESNSVMKVSHAAESKPWQAELDKRITLLLNNKEHRSTNMLGSIHLVETTKLMDEGENPEASSKGPGHQWTNKDEMVIEPKILNQMVKGTGPKRLMEMENPSRSITISKHNPQPNILNHQLMITPKGLLLHYLLIPKNNFIGYYHRESGLWNADKLFDESPRLVLPVESKFTKLNGVWYVVWDRKPSKPPDYMNFFGAIYVPVGHESLQPLEHPDYTISSTHQDHSFMSSAIPLKSAATTLLPILEFSVSVSLNNFTCSNYSQKKPAKPPYCCPISTIIEPAQPTEHPSALIICIQNYPDHNEKSISTWQPKTNTEVHADRVRTKIEYYVFKTDGISLFVEQNLERLYKKSVPSIINGVKHDYGLKNMAMVPAIRTIGIGLIYELIKSDDVSALISTSNVDLKGFQIHIQVRKAKHMMFKGESDSSQIFLIEQGQGKFMSGLCSVVPTVKAEQVAKFFLVQLCNLVCLSKPEVVHHLILKLNSAHAQEVMCRVKNKICSHLDLLGLIRDDYHMELLVTRNKISLDSSITQVYEQLWKKSSSQSTHAVVATTLPFPSAATSTRNSPSMTVTYRFSGVDDAANEPMINGLEEHREESQDPKIEFVIVGAVQECGGLENLWEIIQHLRDELISNQQLVVALNFLMHCYKIREIRRALSRLGALSLLLKIVCHVSSMNTIDLAEDILPIVESLTIEANERDNNNVSTLIVSNEEVGAKEDIKMAGNPTNYSKIAEGVQLVKVQGKQDINRSISKFKGTISDMLQGTQLVIDVAAATGLLKGVIIGDELTNKEKQELSRPLTKLASIILISILMLLPIIAFGHSALLATIQKYVSSLIPSMCRPEGLELLGQLEDDDLCELNGEWVRQSFSQRQPEAIKGATWLNVFAIQFHYLTFRLEDKAGLYGGGIDREHAISPDLYGPYLHLQSPAQRAQF